MNQPLVSFYTKSIPNPSGVSLMQMWSFTPQELEEKHDYIQWLFPTLTPSRFNPEAPILDQETIDHLREDVDFGANFNQSVFLMVDFWTKNNHWHKKNDHNLLRITRFIESCSLLGKRQFAQQMYDYLLELKKDRKKGKFISAENIEYAFIAVTTA